MDSGAALPAPGENKEQSSKGAEGEKGRSIRAYLEFHRAQEVHVSTIALRDRCRQHGFR